MLGPLAIGPGIITIGKKRRETQWGVILSGANRKILTWIYCANSQSRLIKICKTARPRLKRWLNTHTHRLGLGLCVLLKRINAPLLSQREEMKRASERVDGNKSRNTCNPLDATNVLNRANTTTHAGLGCWVFLNDRYKRSVRCPSFVIHIQFRSNRASPDCWPGYFILSNRWPT